MTGSNATPPSTSGVAQPAESLKLCELNQRSAGLGEWEVICFHPHIREYEYSLKNATGKKKGADFRVILVSRTDHTQYVSAHMSMKGSDMAPLIAARDKFKANLPYRISKVKLDTTAQQYLHTPIKWKVNLSNTATKPMMRTNEGEVVQACPAMTIKDCKRLQQSQRFDVTGIIDSFTEARRITDHRQVRTITIIDESGDDGKPAQLSISYFMNVPLNKEDNATVDALEEAVAGETKQVYSLFSVQGCQRDKGYTFEVDSTREFFMVKAIGSRADRLSKLASSLQEVPEADRDVLQQPTYEGRDYSTERGSETVCKLLADMASFKAANESVTVWQLNWVEVNGPEGENLLKKDGSKLWFPITLRDVSGQVGNVWMDEASALSLSGLGNKEEFIENHHEGNQLFPIMATVKLTREVKKAQENGEQYVNLTVVHAEGQPCDEAPSKATMELFPLIKDMSDDTSAIVPAAIEMVHKSPHYAFTVSLPTSNSEKTDSELSIPCQKVLALVRSTKKSVSSNVGEAFKITTPEVEDLLAKTKGKKYTLSALCTLSNLAQYKLDPPRGSHQDALVTICGKDDETWIIENVVLLNKDDSVKVKESLNYLMQLAMHIFNRDRKRKVEWNDTFSPFANKRVCTRMGRAPSDAPLPAVGVGGG
jgi:hypothetical protein